MREGEGGGENQRKRKSGRERETERANLFLPIHIVTANTFGMQLHSPSAWLGIGVILRLLSTATTNSSTTAASMRAMAAHRAMASEREDQPAHAVGGMWRYGADPARRDGKTHATCADELCCRTDCMPALLHDSWNGTECHC